MRQLPVWLVVGLFGACHGHPATPSTGARASSRTRFQPGVLHIEPRTELSFQGPAGRDGSAICGLAVYAWGAAPSRPTEADAGSTGCVVQVNHCAEDQRTGEQTCIDLADERSVSCGGTFDACGQTVQCDCPTGPARPVPDAPGTVHVTRSAGVVRSADGACEATVTQPAWAQNGPAPAPCILAVHERGQPERTQMLSCGVRSDLCDHPVRCDCP